MEQLNKLRVVVASPGDVKSERDILERVAKELNSGIAKDRHIFVEISRWEDVAFPGFHREGPQGIVDQELRIAECDLLIGIFWKRFGTPTAKAKSGTEQEFYEAYNAWKSNGKPQIMMYFNQRPFTLSSVEEAEQALKVQDFKAHFPNEGFFWSYTGEEEFAQQVRQHLTQFILHKNFDHTPVSTLANIGPMASYYSLDEQIALWLKTLTAKLTYDSYKPVISNFREALRLRNLDLNSENDFAIASIFMDWAGTGTRKTEVTSVTYNQRFYALNNFYKFAIQRQFMKRNPLETVKLREIQFIKSAKPLDIQTVRDGLKKADRLKLSGKRDYALLCILLTTGWHASEVVEMRYGGVVKKGNSLTIISRKKGGRDIREVLQKGTAQALEEYLEALEDYLRVIGSKGLSSDAPIWLSFARNETKGKALGRAALTDICKKYLKTTKVDDTRHTHLELKHLEGINGIEKLLGITEDYQVFSSSASTMRQK